MDRSSGVAEVLAVEKLEGLELNGGWIVGRRVERPISLSGSNFSVCYEVSREGQQGFLKAMNFARAFERAREGKVELTDAINEFTSIHNYERDVSRHCRGKYVSNVALAIDDGKVEVPGFGLFGLVPYLIFDKADADVRKLLEYDGHPVTNYFRFASLHAIAVGLWQLHRAEVSHNDLKPSNILVFNASHKLADLGSSVCASVPSPNEKYIYGGDPNYAPPEVFYGHRMSEDHHVCTRAYDLWMIGGMFCFYFTATTMTALIFENLPKELWPGQLKFDEAKDYLIQAFSKSLMQLEDAVDDPYKEDVRYLVERLCYPIPELRGYGLPSSNNAQKLDLERLVTRLDRLRTKAKMLAFPNKI